MAGDTASLRQGGGGAFGHHPRRRVWAAVAALALCAAIGLVLALRPAGDHGLPAVDMHYGGYPSWLPNTKLPSVNTIVRATPGNPKLDVIEGNAVQATLPGGTALITAVGPGFPAWVSAASQAGQLNASSGVPATFTVTLVGRAGTMPLSASSFSVLTSEGEIVRPAVRTMGAGAIPSVIHAGQHVTVVLSAKLIEGNGSVRWAPAGSRVLAGWLYQLELD